MKPNDLEIGQVLTLRIPYNSIGDIPYIDIVHPYLVIDVHDDKVEIAQLDSTKPDSNKHLMPFNWPIYKDFPYEPVLDKNSYLQLNKRITIDNYPELVQHRRQKDKLSPRKLEEALREYYEFPNEYRIFKERRFHVNKETIERMYKEYEDDTKEKEKLENQNIEIQQTPDKKLKKTLKEKQ